MQMHPSHAHFMINDRLGDITRQIKENRLAHEVKALEQGRNGRSPARLSLAGLRSLVGFGNGRVAQAPKADRAASRPELVKPLKPEEQCC
jgi:hypothetical protein